jgi:hypothetical protein
VSSPSHRDLPDTLRPRQSRNGIMAILRSARVQPFFNDNGTPVGVPLCQTDNQALPILFAPV